jgi:hypothetical protein
MRKATALCLCLLVSGTISAVANSAQNGDAFKPFWQKFKAAVIRGDRETVAGLSRFPIGMPRRARSIKNATELGRRYREVFNQPTDAARCFAKEKPIEDPNHPRGFLVSCFNNVGDEIDYAFEPTKVGWKFVRLDRFALPD